MTLLKFTDVSLAYGATPLLDKVSWQIARGERVCIIGRNGTGKSSLLKLVKGDQRPDDGQVWRAPSLKIGELPQELPPADERRAFEAHAVDSASTARSEPEPTDNSMKTVHATRGTKRVSAPAWLRCVVSPARIGSSRPEMQQIDHDPARTVSPLSTRRASRQPMAAAATAATALRLANPPVAMPSVRRPFMPEAMATSPKRHTAVSTAFCPL